MKHYIFGGIVEVVLLSLIVWYAWKWPKQEARVDSIIPLRFIHASELSR